MRFAPPRSSLARVGPLALDVATGLLLAAILGLTLLQVAARYVFGWPTPWSEELNRLLFVWMVMLAAAKGGHMRIEFFVERMSRMARRLLDFALAGLAVTLLCAMAWKSLDLIALTRNDHYVALAVSVQFVYWAAFTGTALWAAGIVAAAVRRKAH